MLNLCPEAVALSLALLLFRVQFEFKPTCMEQVT